MKTDNQKQYEKLLKSEGEKIKKAKYSLRSSSKNFQENLKAKILERRRQTTNMKKILEFLSLSLQPKYAISVILVLFVLFVGISAISLPGDEDGISDNVIVVVSEKIAEKVSELVQPSKKDKVDDWQYFAEQVEEDGRGAGGGVYKMQATAPSAESLGYSTGGAKDINNFRENIDNGYLPLPTDITYEGLFYDYYFETGQQEECDELFCPSYSYALSADPFSNEDEYYLSVGLNSNIKESDFARKKLNLVVVLDISGSMSSPFNQYYYDRFGNRIEGEEKNTNKSKMEVAAESVVALLDHLEDDDRFGMVLFNNSAHLAKPLNLVGETDMDEIKDHILEIQARGGTYMEAGMNMGTELFDDLWTINQSEYENRIIFLTDAMPNIGNTSQESLLGITEKNAANKLHATFIGIGVDFNTELVEYITKIRGANYYSVHSAKEFEKRMDDEFEYMVTPLVFNLLLTLEANGYEIEKVYGSPEANEATGELMKVNTLFPSSTEEGETRGGLVLLKLKKTSPENSLNLKVSYEDRSGNIEDNEAMVEITGDAEYFDNKGIRKGVLLTRYTNLVKNWINDERANHQKPGPLLPCMARDTGIIEPCPIPLGQWERQSIALQVSEHYQELFEEFKDYFEQEMNVIGDDALEQEIDILDKLIDL